MRKNKRFGSSPWQRRPPITPQELRLQLYRAVEHGLRLPRFSGCAQELA
ncbi:MAG: hypothetical protein MUF81_10015 [Verrucomicrobia bacterium]|jgi:hypothetical protein|nr:hypothetical protein [Verrucomicrobiota bacterium]